MATWKLYVGENDHLKPEWITKANESISNQSNKSDNFEVNDNDLPSILNYLENCGFNDIKLYAVEKRIVLPPSNSSSCPNCGGSGRIN